jgi:hypothetical protein
MPMGTKRLFVDHTELLFWLGAGSLPIVCSGGHDDKSLMLGTCRTPPHA